ncbi:related to dnase1 protein [Cephalotrichum gorgonifer]|uniref:Related to dnase1 protein n=1 Tax=Cephalotrichum gorgonifer TaxID=2041049 RepID=A0AAE8MQ23_9PEZI|nr:related to dnase1 protein [Cephalotrichum gorgonifer]
MQFSSLFSTVLAVSSATLALANSVTFISQDSTDRTIIFTANGGGEKLPDLEVAAGATETATFPDGWVGNWFSVSKGASSVPGMLGEVAFQGWNDLTYFDVSAIVNPLDHVGVKEMWPAESKTPTSGCKVFPCNNAYYLPDDIQTKTTTEVDLVCTLGN